jgi:hypothetical protein
MSRTTAIVAILAAAAALLAAFVFIERGRGQAAGAAPVVRTADGRPDLNGIWQAMNTANWDLRDHAARQGPVIALGAAFSVPGGLGVVEGGEIPYQPWAETKRAANAERWLTDDPEIKCYMPGVPRATYMPYPFQIVQTRDNVLFAYEFASASRIVRMGQLGEAPADSWMGWSRGRWDGDTLVVDVTALGDQSWFDRAGDFHSDALHVVERYSLAGTDRLRYEATIEDPKVFTRAWKISMPLYRRSEARAQLFEYKCVEFAEPVMYGSLSRQPARRGAAP